jgi:hypothetical protein
MQAHRTVGEEYSVGQQRGGVCVIAPVLLCVGSKNGSNAMERYRNMRDCAPSVLALSTKQARTTLCTTD